MTNIINNPPSRVGLVGEWLLDGNSNDTSGNGNNGTNTNGLYVKSNRGYVNQCWQGNGSNAKITGLYMINTSSDFSINMNVYFNSLSPLGVIYWRAGASVPYTYLLYNTNGTLTFFINPNSVTTTEQVTTGKWYNITIHRNGTTSSIYINGKLSVSSVVSSSGVNTGNSSELGENENLNYSNIKIQGVRMYNRAITQDEIQLLYLEGQKLLGPTNIAKYPKLFEGLVGYFENPTGTTELWNIATGVNSTRTAGTNTTDNLGNNRALTNPNYTWSSITYTTGYTFENSGSGWSVVTSPSGLSATGINRTTTLRNVFLFSRTLSADEVTLLQNLCNSDYIYPTPSYDLPNLREGLRGSWTLNNDGTNYYDNSGNGYNFTKTGTLTTYRQGKNYFIGQLSTSNYLSKSGDIGITNSGSAILTMNVWVKTSYSSTFGNLLNHILPVNMGFYLFAHNGTYQLDAAKFGIADQFLNSGVSVDGNKRIMITGVFNAGTFSIYIDGKLMNSSTYQTNPSGSNSYNTYCGGTGNTNAYISYPRIRNRVLTAKEVEQLYYSTKGNFIY